MIKEIQKQANDKMTKAVESLKSNLSKIRTGRAQPAILDCVMVDYLLMFLIKVQLQQLKRAS